MVKIDNKMKATASMVKTILEGMFNSKVETGWSFSEDTYMLIYLYDKDNKYNYQKFEIEYIEDKDDADYCSELVNMMLNGTCDYHESSCEERYLSDILEETGVKNLYIMNGRLYDSTGEIDIDLSAIDRLDYDKSGANIVLQEDDGYMYQVDMVQEYIREIEK